MKLIKLTCCPSLSWLLTFWPTYNGCLFWVEMNSPPPITDDEWSDGDIGVNHMTSFVQGENIFHPLMKRRFTWTRQARWLMMLSMVENNFQELDAKWRVGLTFKSTMQPGIWEWVPGHNGQNVWIHKRKLDPLKQRNWEATAQFGG